MRKLGLLKVIPLSLLISGCATIPHDLNLSIDASNPQSDIGDGLSIYINVIDDRDSEIIGGRRGNAGKIIANQLMPIFEATIKDGFKNKGFTIAQDRDAEISLTVKLRTFNRLLIVGALTENYINTVVINAEARNATSSLQKKYRFSNEDRVLFIVDNNMLDRSLNAVLNKTISELLNDRELDKFLSKN